MDIATNILGGKLTVNFGKVEVFAVDERRGQDLLGAIGGGGGDGRMVVTVAVVVTAAVVAGRVH